MTLDIPGTYSLITVGQIYDYFNAADDFERVSAMCNVPKDKLITFPVSVIQSAIEKIAEMIATEKEFTQFKTVVKVRHGFKRKEYGFIPVLNDVSGAEYLDFITLAKPDVFKKNIIKLMCLMYRPITIRMGKQYQIQEYDTLKNHLYEADVRSMPASILSGALLFFSTLQKELHVTTLDTLQKKMEKTNRDLLLELTR